MKTATETSAYERLGRELKAQRIARKIWAHLPRELRTDPRVPEAFSQASAEERRGWAEAAADKPVKKVPSDLTWNRVTALLAEKVADERRWLGQLEQPRAAS